MDIREDISLTELLYHDLILLFVDPEHKTVWIWKGRGSTTRMKFLSAQLAPNIRDRYGIDHKILAVEDGNEDAIFKVLVGLE